MTKICYRFCDLYHLFIKHEQKSPRLWHEVEFALANNSFGPAVYKASYVVILCNLQELVKMFGFYDHIDYLRRTSPFYRNKLEVAASKFNKLSQL